MTSKINDIKSLMYKIDETYRQNVLLESNDFEKRWIDELNTMYKKDGSYGKKLYHSAGMHSRIPLEDVIMSICQNGLTVDSSIDGDGIGNVIWFSDNFADYGENGLFVVSIQLTGENRVRFDLGYDGHNGYAEKDIPFEYLTVETIPILKGWFGYFTNRDAESDFYKKLDRATFETMLKMAKESKDKELVMYIDAWDYMGIPYDTNIIKEMNNITIKKLGITQ